jgi:hypothetical protein
MPANGTEGPTTEPKISPPSATDSKSGRGAADSKLPGARGATTRRRRGHDGSPKATGEERFFLAGPNRNGDAPALGRECASEAEAIIDAFRERLNFYRISEFQTRADVSPSGEPVLRKEALKNNNPAS